MRYKISLREETENRSQHSLCAETISRLVLLMTDVKWLLAEMIGTWSWWPDDGHFTVLVLVLVTILGWGDPQYLLTIHSVLYLYLPTWIKERMKLSCYCRYRIHINKVLNYICRMDIRIRIKIENIQLFIDGGKSILYLQIQWLWRSRGTPDPSLGSILIFWNAKHLFLIPRLNIRS